MITQKHITLGPDTSPYHPELVSGLLKQFRTGLKKLVGRAVGSWALPSEPSILRGFLSILKGLTKGVPNALLINFLIPPGAELCPPGCHVI
jgi:hypothetical protein